MIFSGRNFKPNAKVDQRGFINISFTQSKKKKKKFLISLFNSSQTVVSIELAKKFIQVCYLRERPK